MLTARPDNKVRSSQGGTSKPLPPGIAKKESHIAQKIAYKPVGVHTNTGQRNLMDCLYCEKPEKNYKPSRGIEFICSRCVMAFLSADQDYLKWVYDLAIKNSMPDKARAIESFILPEETDGKQFNPKSRTRDIGKHFNRRGNFKADRLEKVTTRSIAKQRRLSIFEGEPEQSALP